MIGFLIGWMVEHLLLSGVIALLGAIGVGAGVRAVRRHQKKRDKARSADIAQSRKANAAAKAAKPKTAAQILREQRKQQPLGVVVRKRAAGDERRKAPKRLLDKLRVHRANAKAATPEKPRVLELAAEKIVNAGPKVSKTPRTHPEDRIIYTPEEQEEANRAWDDMARKTPLVGRCNKPTGDGSLCRRRVSAGRDCGANHKAA